MCTASTSHKAADSQENKEVVMKKKGYKGRCEKRSLLKCVGICRTYDPIQSAYADRLEADEQVKEFQCNVLLTYLRTCAVRILHSLSIVNISQVLRLIGMVVLTGQ